MVPLRTSLATRDVVCMDSETETSLTALSDGVVLSEPEARLVNEGISSETVAVVVRCVVDEGTSSVDSTTFVAVIVVLGTFVVVIVNVVTLEFSDNDVDATTSERDLV